MRAGVLAGELRVAGDLAAGRVDEVERAGAGVAGRPQRDEDGGGPVRVVLGRRSGQQRGQLGGAGVGEQVVQAQGPPGAPGQLAQQAHGEQGVPAGVEEVGAGGDVGGAEHRLPGLLDQAGLGAVGPGGGVVAGAVRTGRVGHPHRRVVVEGGQHVGHGRRTAGQIGQFAQQPGALADQPCRLLVGEPGAVVDRGQDQAAVDVPVGEQRDRERGLRAGRVGQFDLDALRGQGGAQVVGAAGVVLEDDEALDELLVGAASAPLVDLPGGHPLVGGHVEGVVAQFGQQPRHGRVRVDPDGHGQRVHQQPGQPLHGVQGMPRPETVTPKPTGADPEVTPAR